MLNRFLIALAFVFALIVAGCGGGGTPGTDGGSGGTFGATRVETVITGTNLYVDPLNIQVGDHVTFQLARYNLSTFSRQVVGVSGSWSTDDIGNQAGVLASSGGYVASNVAATTYTASATSSSDSLPYQRTYKVLPMQASVRGTVKDTLGKPVAGVVVAFYNAGGTEVGRTTSSGNGTIYASVPTSATRFHVLSSSVNTSLYQQYYTFGGFGYSPIIATCTAHLPSLTVGVTATLSTNVVLYSKFDALGNLVPPPPPPTGCQ